MRPKKPSRPVTVSHTDHRFPGCPQAQRKRLNPPLCFTPSSRYPVAACFLMGIFYGALMAEDYWDLLPMNLSNLPFEPLKVVAITTSCGGESHYGPELCIVHRLRCFIRLKSNANQFHCLTSSSPARRGKEVSPCCIFHACAGFGEKSLKAGIHY